MRFAVGTIAMLALANVATGFTHTSFSKSRTYSGSRSRLSMAVDLPPEVNKDMKINRPVIVNDFKLESSPGGAPTPIRYSNFIKILRDDQVEKVTFAADGTKLLGVDVNGVRFAIESLPPDAELVNELAVHNVDVTVLPAEEAGSGLGDLAQSLIFPAALFAGLFFLSRRASGGSPGGPPGPGGMGGFGQGGPMGFGKSKAQVQMIPDTGVSFDEVAGCDGAKQELAEVVDFLKRPEDFTSRGAKIPRGVILEGPPGTGKTLLAKAVAGEAGVPFISISGSEFVEMFVGVGASRVRDIYAQAKKNAPCIIFIDEIDAVGRQRGAGYAGGNDEREQTVNQILVEMDGFGGNLGIITMAATNRIDILDQALLRPGRFDRKVTVDLPDFKGRAKILAVHGRGKPLEPDVDLEAIARRTPGFSGAQLENLMNEAAIAAARNKQATLTWDNIDNAVDRIMVGLEKRGAINQQDKIIVAYHEAGHAIVGAAVPDYDQVQKITIIPRSNGAGGLTFFAPSESRLESGMYSAQYLEAQLAVALGGRLAEELIFGMNGVTTGASNDLQQVTNVAVSMTKQWGMSNRVGSAQIEDDDGGNPFMGMRMLQGETSWGNSVGDNADSDVERIVSHSYLIAKKILKDNIKLLHHVAATLMDQEVITAEEFESMIVKYGVKTIDYERIQDEIQNEKMPFSKMPTRL